MDYQKQKEHQYQREKMDEVRRHRKPPESRSHKISRLSKDPVAVDAANQKVRRVNKAAQKLLRAIEDLSDDKDAWPLGFAQAADLFESKVNMPNALGNKLLGLARLRNKLGDRWLIDDYKALELFAQLNHKDLMNTTLRIIQERSQKPTLDRIISTIKEIHVNKLKSFTIPKTILKKFIKNKYVAKTRPDIEPVSLSSDIHHQFEEMVSSRVKRRTGPRGFDDITPRHDDELELKSSKPKRRKLKRRVK